MAEPVRRVTGIPQQSPEWRQWRRDGIGGSDAPVIVGVSPYRGPLELWMEKVGESVPEPDPVTARRFLIGHLLEGPLLDLFESDHGVRVERGPLFERIDRPFLRASLDGAILREDGTVETVVEAKWSNAGRWEDDGEQDPEVPEDVLVQVQHQIYVTGAERAMVLGLIRGVPREVQIDPDPEMIDLILSMERRFWPLVRDRVRPGPGWVDGRESTRRAIQSAYPVEREPMGEAPEDVAALVRELLDLRAIIRSADRKAEAVREAELENAIRFLVGDREGFEGPGFRVTYRSNKPSVETGWEQIASGFRERLAEVDPEWDADTIVGLFTREVPGSRVLRIRASKGDQG